MLTVHTSSSPLEEGAKALKKELLGDAHKDTLILFSGGSSLALIDYMHPDVLPLRSTISILDDRYTFEKNESNFSLLEKTTFFKGAKERGIQHIDPRPLQEETLEEAGNRFDLALKEWHVTHKEGRVVATIGIGPDGHVAGILPMPKKSDAFKKIFFDARKCAVGYEISPEINPHTKRITTTLTYIERHIEHAVIYATGTQKRDALTQMLEKDKEEFEKIPARIVHRIQHATLFTDISLT